jgi:biofilm PGA synthesis N-glycosyltransferase PgaC
MQELPNYVIITPARNEAEFIRLTIESVVVQSARPLKWVIVSDGSTDETDAIVNEYLAKNPWIQLIRMPDRIERNFAGKVHAFNAGYASVKDLCYEALVSLDADTSFDEHYFSFLLQKLSEDSALGLIGTPFMEDIQGHYDYRFVNIEHVSGACQVFRRECFDDIGGYTPVKRGCIDHIAVVSARMKGWKTRTFTDKICLHHRRMGTAKHGALRARFVNGQQDYTVGNHPLWELCRAVYQGIKKPVLLGGMMVLSGYVCAALQGEERPVSKDLVAFQRREQMQRLKRLLTGY